MKRLTVSTDNQISKLKPKDRPYDAKVLGTSGLTLRVHKTGVKSFRYDRGAQSKPRIVTYSRFPALIIKDAIALHKEAKQAHQIGAFDSVTSDRFQTVEDLFNHWYSDCVIKTRIHPDVVQRVMNHDVIPVIGKLKLNQVTALHVRDAVLRVVDRGATTLAGKVLSTIKQMFTYAVSLGLVPQNPAISLKPSFLGIANNSRSRVLTDEEIVNFWGILSTSGTEVSFATRTALQVLLLTGLRSGEARQLTWDCVDTDNHAIIIPVENQKMTLSQRAKANSFVVPISGFTMRRIQQLKGLDTVYVFAGNTAGTCLSDRVFGHYVRRVLSRPTVELDPFTTHDLRRTFRTNLAKLGVDPVIAERCLNHSLGKIVSTYNLHHYIPERRAALKMYSDYIQRLVARATQ